MRLEVYFIDDTWARVKFHGDNDYYLGSLAPSRGDSLPEIIRVAILAGWSITYPELEEVESPPIDPAPKP